MGSEQPRDAGPGEPAPASRRDRLKAGLRDFADAPWSRLRATGNLYALKVSYLVLAAVPFLGDLEDRVDGLPISELWFSVAFFAALLLALANLVYDIACPSVIKRFAAPADMWKDMLEIKRRAAVLRLGGKYNATLDHAVEEYRCQNWSRPGLRITCYALYLGAAALFLLILCERVVSVLGLLF